MGEAADFLTNIKAGLQAAESSVVKIETLLVIPFLVHDRFLSLFGGFLKWWYPQIIHFDRVFQYKRIHFGVPLFLETPVSFLISHFHLMEATLFW